MRARSSLVLHSFTATAVAATVVGLSRLVYNAFVEGQLGVEALGHANAIISLATITSLPVYAAMQATASHFLAKARGREDLDKANKIRQAIVATTLVGSLLALGILVVISLFTGVPTWYVPGDGWWVAGLILTSSFYYVLRGVHLGLGQAHTYARKEILSNVFMIVSFLSIIYFPSRSNSLLPIYVLQISFLVLSVRHLALNPKKPLWVRGEQLRFGALALAGSALSTARIHVGVLFVANMIGTAGAGIFSGSFYFTTALMLVSSALGAALLPELSARIGRGDGKGARLLFLRSTKILALLGVPLFLVASAAAETILTLAFDATFADRGAQVFRILAIVSLVQFVNMPAVTLMVSSGYIRLSAVFATTSLLLASLLWWWWIPLFGLEGAAWAYAASAGSSAVLFILVAQRVHGQAMGRIWAMILTGIAFACVLILIAPAGEIPWAGFALSFAFMLAFWQDFRALVLEFWSSTKG